MADLSQLFNIFILAISPVVECRGSIPYGIVAGVDLPTVLLVTLVGNCLPVPFLLLLLKTVEGWLMRRGDSNPLKRLFIRYVESLRRRSRDQVEKYGFLGLVLFVAIPVPGTGAWTSSIVAYLFGMEWKRSLAAIVIGVLCAMAIVTVLTLAVGVVL
ncbi:MAG: small multi-drug export protein [Candidatus Methanosuratus sp.]|nr:small multi-drug export protein [Candidatus Methanosuratincola sp.]